MTARVSKSGAAVARRRDALGAQRRPPRGRLAVLILAAAVVAGTTACDAVIDGVPVAAGSSPARTGAGADGRDDRYQPLPDGRGFSDAPLDQPPPLPGMRWAGWTDPCAWLAPDLLATAGGRAPQFTALGCVFPAAPPGDAPLLLQIGWTGAYSMDPGPVEWMRPVEVAGLQAREFARPGMKADQCGLHLNTRSTIMLTVVAYDADDDARGGHEPRCDVARRIGDAIARRYVPLAGGTPYAGTPTRPDADLLAAPACDIVHEHVANAANLRGADPRPGRSGDGTTCTYASEYATATATLTDAPLDEKPPLDGSRPPEEHAIIGMPARLASDGQRCGVAIELDAAVVLHIVYEYASDIGHRWACKQAEVMAADAIAGVLEKTS